MDITTRVLTTFQLWNKTFMEATVTRLEKESIIFGIHLICQLFHDPFLIIMYPTILTTTWTLQPECQLHSNYGIRHLWRQWLLRLPIYGHGPTLQRYR